MFESEPSDYFQETSYTVNKVFKNKTEVNLEIWVEHFSKPCKERNKSLNMIFETNLILMKRKYFFLEESQIMGRTLSSFGIENICGEVSKTFLQKLKKIKSRTKRLKRTAGSQSTRQLVSSKNKTPRKISDSFEKMLIARYPPVAERWSDAAFRKFKDFTGSKGILGDQSYTFSNDENQIKSTSFNSSKTRISTDVSTKKFNTSDICEKQSNIVKNNTKSQRDGVNQNNLELKSKHTKNQLNKFVDNSENNFRTNQINTSLQANKDSGHLVEDNQRKNLRNTGINSNTEGTPSAHQILHKAESNQSDNSEFWSTIAVINEPESTNTSEKKAILKETSFKKSVRFDDNLCSFAPTPRYLEISQEPTSDANRNEADKMNCASNSNNLTSESKKIKILRDCEHIFDKLIKDTTVNNMSSAIEGVNTKIPTKKPIEISTPEFSRASDLSISVVSFNPHINSKHDELPPINDKKSNLISEPHYYHGGTTKKSDFETEPLHKSNTTVEVDKTSHSSAIIEFQKYTKESQKLSFCIAQSDQTPANNEILIVDQQSENLHTKKINSRKEKVQGLENTGCLDETTCTLSDSTQNRMSSLPNSKNNIVIEETPSSSELIGEKNSSGVVGSEINQSLRIQNININSTKNEYYSNDDKDLITQKIWLQEDSDEEYIPLSNCEDSLESNSEVESEKENKPKVLTDMRKSQKNLLLPKHKKNVPAMQELEFEDQMKTIHKTNGLLTPSKNIVYSSKPLSPTGSLSDREYLSDDSVLSSNWDSKEISNTKEIRGEVNKSLDVETHICNKPQTQAIEQKSKNKVAPLTNTIVNSPLGNKMSVDFITPQCSKLFQKDIYEKKIDNWKIINAPSKNNNTMKNNDDSKEINLPYTNLIKVSNSNTKINKTLFPIQAENPKNMGEIESFNQTVESSVQTYCSIDAIPILHQESVNISNSVSNDDIFNNTFNNDLSSEDYIVISPMSEGLSRKRTEIADNKVNSVPVSCSSGNTSKSRLGEARITKFELSDEIQLNKLTHIKETKSIELIETFDFTQCSQIKVGEKAITSGNSMLAYSKSQLPVEIIQDKVFENSFEGSGVTCPIMSLQKPPNVALSPDNRSPTKWPQEDSGEEYIPLSYCQELLESNSEAESQKENKSHVFPDERKSQKNKNLSGPHTSFQATEEHNVVNQLKSKKENKEPVLFTPNKDTIYHITKTLSPTRSLSDCVYSSDDCILSSHFDSKEVSNTISDKANDIKAKESSKNNNSLRKLVNNIEKYHENHKNQPIGMVSDENNFLNSPSVKKLNQIIIPPALSSSEGESEKETQGTIVSDTGKDTLLAFPKYVSDVKINGYNKSQQSCSLSDQFKLTISDCVDNSVKLLLGTSSPYKLESRERNNSNKTKEIGALRENNIVNIKSSINYLTKNENISVQRNKLVDKFNLKLHTGQQSNKNVMTYSKSNSPICLKTGKTKNLIENRSGNSALSYAKSLKIPLSKPFRNASIKNAMFEVQEHKSKIDKLCNEDMQSSKFKPTCSKSPRSEKYLNKTSSKATTLHADKLETVLLNQNKNLRLKNIDSKSSNKQLIGNYSDEDTSVSSLLSESRDMETNTTPRRDLSFGHFSKNLHEAFDVFKRSNENGSTHATRKRKHNSCEDLFYSNPKIKDKRKKITWPLPQDIDNWDNNLLPRSKSSDSENSFVCKSDSLVDNEIDLMSDEPDFEDDIINAQAGLENAASGSQSSYNVVRNFQQGSDLSSVKTDSEFPSMGSGFVPTPPYNSIRERNYYLANMFDADDSSSMRSFSPEQEQ